MLLNFDPQQLLVIPVLTRLLLLYFISTFAMLFLPFNTDNRVFNPLLANISGFDHMAQLYGDYYTYNATPRFVYHRAEILI
jgi:hypothetical protein